MKKSENTKKRIEKKESEKEQEGSPVINITNSNKKPIGSKKEEVNKSSDDIKIKDSPPIKNNNKSFQKE